MRKRNIVAARYANAVSQRVVRVSRRKQLGDNAIHATEYSLEMSAMPTTADPTEKASLCVKKIINVRSVTKSSRTRKGSQRITCVEKRCVGTVKNMLTQINTDVL